MRVLFFLFFSFLFFASESFAKTVLTDKSSRIVIGKNLSVLQSDHEMTFNEVLLSTDFVESNRDVPNFGLTPYSVWLKFEVTNQSRVSHYLLNVAYPILDEVDLYYPTDSGFKIVKQGEVFPFEQRSYNSPNYIFSLDVPIGKTQTYFLRIKSSEQIIVPISINRPISLVISLGQEDLVLGVYIGVVLIMIFYNLFLFLSVRDRSYLFYVLYVLFTGLTQVGIKGYNYKYLWPQAPDFQLRSIVIFASVSCLAALAFAWRFLDLQRNAPKMRRISPVLSLLFLIAIGFTGFGKIQTGFQIMQAGTTLFSLITLVLSFVVMYRGFEPARYFFAAWSVLLVGSIIFLLKDYGILPYNVATSYVMQAASALEMALLSFGLANSINILKKEKEQSQLLALQASQENERMVIEQNVILEQRVAERTRALETTNDDLASTLDNLKQAQSQLVEAEKMASLGQLTAGIAHEINNPINFVTSNVGPLKRDVAMVFETIEFVETLCLEAGLSPDDKKHRIEQFKEDMDYDYLKVEISHLLNGIHEGSSRTAEIVKGLRIFSRVDENDLKRADINEGIESSLIIVNNQLNGKIEVKREFAKDLPLIECYPGKLNQVFLNIISNAIHAVKQQHGDKDTGLITIKTRAFDDHITVEFMDNGIGMSEEIKKKIYEPFFTTKEVGEGTGLGMSIVYNTIKKHNGTITLVSQLGQGTSFLINLPIVHEIKSPEN